MRSLSLVGLLLVAVAVAAQAQKATPDEDKQIEELIKQVEGTGVKGQNPLITRAVAAKAVAGYGAKADKALAPLVRLHDKLTTLGSSPSLKEVEVAIDRIVVAMLERDRTAKSLSELVDGMGHKDADVRLRSVKYFMLVQDASLSRMAKAATDRDEDVRALANKSVRKADLTLRVAPPNVEHLVADLKDEDASIRLRAAKKLGMLGNKAASAAPALTQAAKEDEDDDVKRVAAEALESVGKK